MRITVLLLAVSLHAAAAGAQGAIAGRVTDKSGALLPGVDVVASSSSAQGKTVSDASGDYEIKSLPAGTYAVTASLMGFVTAKREGVTLASGQIIEHVDFSLCVSGLTEIDWVLWGGLEEAWKRADVVAYVRIVATGPVNSECPNRDFLHTAGVIEMFKRSANAPIQKTLTFRQEKWLSERTSYVIGQKMIVFLVAVQQELWRMSGPYYVFLVDGDQITSFHSPIRTEGMTPADFCSKLRALAKGSR